MMTQLKRSTGSSHQLATLARADIRDACREQATLRLRVEGVGAGSSGAPQLCYEVDVSGKVHESGRLGADSAVACGNVDGLKPEIQPHTLRITEDARSPAKSFCGGPWPPSPSHAPCPAAPRQL